MNFLKIGLLFAALTLFIVACTQTNPTSNNASRANAGNGTTTNNVAPVAGNNQTSTDSVKPNGTTASTATATSQQDATTVSAAETFKTICARCHKENGEGGEITANGKKHKVPNFKSERMKNDEDGDFIDAITNGIPEDGMPAFKDKLTDEQIKNLLIYIRKDIQGK